VRKFGSAQTKELFEIRKKGEELSKTFSISKKNQNLHPELQELKQQVAPQWYDYINFDNIKLADNAFNEVYDISLAYKNKCAPSVSQKLAPGETYLCFHVQLFECNDDILDNKWLMHGIWPAFSKDNMGPRYGQYASVKNDKGASTAQYYGGFDVMLNHLLPTLASCSTLNNDDKLVFGKSKLDETLDLWHHEWKKHGEPSGVFESQQAYLASSVAFVREYRHLCEASTTENPKYPKNRICDLCFDLSFNQIECVNRVR